MCDKSKEIELEAAVASIITWNDFLLILCWVENVNPQEDLLNAFGCLGSVIQDFKDFPGSSSCSDNVYILGTHCLEDEISCRMESKECRGWWPNQRSTEVFIFIRFLASIFLEYSKKLSYECKCKEYRFDCSIKSKTLIQYLVHNNTYLTSTVTTASLQTTAAVTLPVTTNSQTTQHDTTDCNRDEKFVNPTASSKGENQETSYISTVAALFGGVILGAGVEFVVIMLVRRKTKPTNECKSNAPEKSIHNPAYTINKDCSEVVVTPEEYYTQITNQNNVYQNISKEETHHQYKSTQETDAQSTYNHLHESKEIESTNYYDHALKIPFEFPANENGYGTVAPQSSQVNTYTEVIGGEEEHQTYGNVDENVIYFELENKM